MKAKILTGLSMALFATCATLRADDTPAQAAARAALEQEFYQLDHASAQIPAQTNVVAVDKAPANSAVKKDAAPGLDAALHPTTGPVIADTNVSAAFPKTNQVASVPADDTAAQTRAMAALNQKMEELNSVTNQTSAAAESMETKVAAPSVAPPLGASVATAPITETPAAEAPVARTPAIAVAAATPVSVPAVTTPTPEVPRTPTTGAVPAVSTGSDAARPVMQTTTAPVAAPPTVFGLPKSSPGHARPTNELVTVGGKIYKNVEVERVTADGIVISYTPSHGGWATARVPFADLPAELRRQYQK